MTKTLFPACAGMNRYGFYVFGELDPVPRMRGDEPTMPTIDYRLGDCSPHARG